MIRSRLLESNNYDYTRLLKLICVTETKSEDDFEYVTNAKDEHGMTLFEELKQEPSKANPIDLGLSGGETKDQYYIFNLVRSDEIRSWFR